MWPTQNKFFVEFVLLFAVFSISPAFAGNEAPTHPNLDRCRLVLGLVAKIEGPIMRHLPTFLWQEYLVILMK